MGFIRDWWNRISPNERAAYIGGVIAVSVTVIGISRQKNDTTPGQSSAKILSSAPSAPPQPLGLGLEEFCRLRDSLASRPGFLTAYIMNNNGRAVSWDGVVYSIGIPNEIRVARANAANRIIISLVLTDAGNIVEGKVCDLKPGDQIHVTGKIAANFADRRDFDSTLMISDGDVELTPKSFPKPTP